MAISLKDLKPTVVTRDLKGKFVFLYGAPKIGKTTLAVQFPKNLLMAVEHGYNAIDGIMAVDVPTWGEFKKYLKQLSDPEIMEQFDTITIDTVGLLYERCEQYICDRENVDKVGDVPYGAGYKMVDQEFEGAIRKITQIMDETGKTAYGLCLIGHESVRVDSDGQTSVKYITPDVNKRCSNIINRMVDLTAYIGMENEQRYIYPRQITLQDGMQKIEIYAGSHFENLNDKIELGYDPLVNAIADAMESKAKSSGSKISDAPIKAMPQEKHYDIKTLKTSIGTIAKALMKLDEGEEEPHFMNDYRAIAEGYLGKGKLVKDAGEAQGEHLELILEDLNDYVSKNNIAI